MLRPKRRTWTRWPSAAHCFPTRTVRRHCAIRRASLLTGLRPSSTGIYGLAPGIRNVDITKNAVTLPQYFEKGGYFTASFGKIFHDGSINREQKADEFTHWGIAPGMVLPEKKFVDTPATIRGMDWGVFPAA